MINCSSQSGKINLILGPMYSGKTTELFRLARRYQLAGKHVGIVKYSGDNRYNELFACTHDMTQMEAINASSIAEIYAQLLTFDVVAIDEGQFFTDIAAKVNDLAEAGKIVIVASLNAGYKQQVCILEHFEPVQKFSLSKTLFSSLPWPKK